MRAMLVGWAIVAGCGGSGSPHTQDGGGNGDGDGSNPITTPITFTLTNAPGDTAAFSFLAAYQDGDGAWQLPSRNGDAFTFGVGSNTWGFAYTCDVNVRVAGAITALRDVVEYHFAVAERTAVTDDILARCTDRLAYVELSGNVKNRPTMGTYRIAYNGNAVFIDRTTGNYSMLVLPGTHDLVVTHGTDRNTDGDFLIDQSIVQRDVVVSGAKTVDIDGNTLRGTATVQVNVSGGNPITSQTTTNLFTGNHTAVALAHLTAAPLQSTALASTQGKAGDVYDQRVTVEIVAKQRVTATNATATPANWSVAAPKALGAATATSAATAPYPRFTSTWPVYADAIGYTWSLAQTLPAAACTAPNCTNTWSATISPGAAGAAPSYTMPDLSGLPGWAGAFQLVAGTMATGEVMAMTSSAGAMDFPPAPPAVGTKRVFAHSTFTVTP